MPNPDTFAESAKTIQAVADRIRQSVAMNEDGEPDDQYAKRHLDEAEELSKAARLLAAAGEEVRAWRAWKKCVVRYMTAEVPSPHEKIERMQKARAALNALAPELKENDHEG